MAATKRSSKVSPIIADSSLQVLHRIKWKLLNTGGQVRYYEEEERGNELVRPITPEEIKPNEKYYQIDPLKSNHFYETYFHPDVEWDTILEFINTKKIYIKYAKPNQDSPSEPSANRDQGPMQSSLF